MTDLSAHGARLLQELHDRTLALKNLKAQVQQLNAEFHAAKSKCQQTEARLLELQEQTVQQGAERATNQVTARDKRHNGDCSCRVLHFWLADGNNLRTPNDGGLLYLQRLC